VALVAGAGRRCTYYRVYLLTYLLTYLLAYLIYLYFGTYLLTDFGQVSYT
jgi:hypothetical protein